MYKLIQLLFGSTRTISISSIEDVHGMEIPVIKRIVIKYNSGNVELSRTETKTYYLNN